MGGLFSQQPKSCYLIFIEPLANNQSAADFDITKHSFMHDNQQVCVTDNVLLPNENRDHNFISANIIKHVYQLSLSASRVRNMLATRELFQRNENSLPKFMEYADSYQRYVFNQETKQWASDNLIVFDDIIEKANETASKLQSLSM